MKRFFLWLLAILLMFAAIIYQRNTGPTYPIRGTIESKDKNYKYELIRTHETTQGATIVLPKPGDSNFTASLHYKRFQTKDTLTRMAFRIEKLPSQEGFLYRWFPKLKRKNDTAYVATLPMQPAAGKMAYFITGTIDGKSFRIPEKDNDSIVLRYKDPVPNWALIPHVFFMFFAVLFGMRAGLSALFDIKTMRKWAIISLVGMTVGGMILGLIVQKYAFGEYWTGFPFGKDFTDNKMLIMWIVWLLAVAIIGFKSKKKETLNRIIVFLAALIMIAAYLIPHSMGGSTLDYDQVDKGVAPEKAIKTGK